MKTDLYTGIKRGSLGVQLKSDLTSVCAGTQGFFNRKMLVSDIWVLLFFISKVPTRRLHSVELKLRIKYHLDSRTLNAAESLFCFRDLGIKQYF